MMTIEDLLSNNIPETDKAPSYEFLINLKLHLFDQLIEDPVVIKKVQVILKNMDAERISEAVTLNS